MLSSGPASWLQPTSRRSFADHALTQHGALGMLLLAALFWGAGNVANKTLLADVGPLTALSLRTLIAACLLLPFLRAEGRGMPDRAWWQSAVTVGILFVLAATFQQAAYQWTTVTNASFLVNTCAAMTPVLAWLMFRQRPGLRIVLAAVATLVGAWAMSGMPAGVGMVNLGDAACLASALCYAGWAIALGHHATRHGRPMTMTVVQFVLASAVLAPGAIAFEAPTIGGIIAAGPEILFLAIFSTAGACVLTTLAQRRIPASVAVVVLSLESVFGAVAATVLLDEAVTALALSGGAMILIAVWVAAGDTARRSC